MGEKYLVFVEEPMGPDGLSGTYVATWRVVETGTSRVVEAGSAEGPTTDKVSLYAEAERQAYAAKAALESGSPVVESAPALSSSPSVPESGLLPTPPPTSTPQSPASSGAPPVAVPTLPPAVENPPVSSSASGTGVKVSPHDGKLSRDPLAGLDNTVIEEMQPRYASAECEKEIKGRNNARIILGRDRNHSVISGYGGLGHTRAGAIDIVVGLQGWAPSEGGNWKGQPGRSPWIPGHADKNFGSMNNDKPGDAARIYISQRANIDEYFDLCEGSVGHSVADSAIGLKADSIRIMSRKGIKLVTGKNPPGRNSMDGKLTETFGIDLIAGNRDLNTGIQMPGVSYPTPLQPIPKGDNLEEALLAIVERVDRLNNIVSSVLMGLQTLTQTVMEPRVGGNAGGPVTATLTAGMANCIKFMTDIQRYSGDLNVQRQAISALKMDFLNEMGIKYINSRHNRTN